MLSRNALAFAAVRFAIARMGAVTIPANFMLNDQGIADILKYSGAKYLMVDEEHAEAESRQTNILPATRASS